MPGKPVNTFRSYLLHCWPEPYATSDQRSQWRFTVEEVMGEHQQREFHTFEQVMNFLLDELLSEPEEAQMKDD